MWFSRFCLSILLRYTCTIRLYQNRQIWHMDSPRYLAQQWKLGQRVKGQGQRVTKCITSYPQPCLFKAIEWSASVMHSIECSASGFNRAFHILLTLVVWMTYEMHTRSHSRRIVPRKPQKTRVTLFSIITLMDFLDRFLYFCTSGNRNEYSTKQLTKCTSSYATLSPH